MTYIEMCHYIVANEGFQWTEFIRNNKNRETDYSRTRQICMYFAYVFFKNMSYREAGKPFGKDHATAMHAYSVIAGEIETNVDLRRKINAYQSKISDAIYANWPTDKKEADEILDNVEQTITKMKKVAEAYCKIMKKKMVDI